MKPQYALALSPLQLKVLFFAEKVLSFDVEKVMKNLNGKRGKQNSKDNV